MWGYFNKGGEMKELIAEYLPYIKLVETYSKTFVEFTKANPVVGGVFGAWLLGVITYTLKSIPLKILGFLRRYATVSITLNNQNESFHYFLNWIAENKNVESFRTTRVSNGTYGHGKTTVSLGLGGHYMMFQKIPIKVGRYIDSHEGARTKETVTITTIGFSQKRLHELVKKTIPERVDNLSVYLFEDGSWRKETDLPKRSWDSVILKKGQKERILRFIDDFKNSKDWYDDMGISYQTGIILEGPPGTGKSSFIKALANKLNMNLAFIKTGLLTDITFQQALARLPKNTIVLMEDFDSISNLKSRDVKKEGNSLMDMSEMMGVSLSGFLNAVDGVFSSNGRILIATTNSIKHLDEAVLRPGRFDLVEHLGYTDKTMVEGMYNKFYKSPLSVKAVSEKISPAKVENVFVINKSDPQKAKESLQEIGITL